MPDIKEHIEYLSQEIGPRPAGTEEEQKASLYIAEQFQREAGLPASVEDFSGVGDPELTSMIYAGIAVFFALLALLVPGLGLIWFVGALVGAGLLVADVTGHPVLSRFLGKGVSQNVVAKYEPGSQSEGSARKRRVIVIARYDSGKVRQELASPFVKFLPIAVKGSMAATVAMPILLLLKSFLLGSAGILGTILTVLIVVAIVFAAIPLVTGILHRAAAYNEGANNNASGVAAMLEVAKRIGTGRMSEAELAEREDAIMRGEAAARENGLVPEGADFVYSGDSSESGAGLNAAKAAVAALSGKPVSGMSEEDVARNLDLLEEQAAEEAEAAAQVASTMEASSEVAAEEVLIDDASNEEAASVVAPQDIEQAPEPAAAVEESSQSESFSSVPDWFRKGQEKAKKPKNTEKPAQRSRYASAFEAITAEGTGQFAQAASEAAKEVQAAASAEPVRHVVHEVHAPQWGVIDSAEPEHSDESVVAQEPEVDEVAAVSASQEPVDLIAANAGETIPFEAVPMNADAPQEEIPARQADVPVAIEDSEANVEPVPEPAAASEPAAAPERKPVVPVIPVSADPSATVATPPIDVSMLNIEGANVKPSVPMPSFLDARKVQEEARAKRSAAARSGNRVDATDAEITSTGVVDQSTLVAETPFSVPAQQPATPEQPQATAEGSQKPKRQHTRRPVLLPNISAAEEKATPVISQAKQRAPLADVEESGKAAAKSLLRTLPTIGSADVLGETADSEKQSASAPAPERAKNASLLVSLPSLSGAIKAADTKQDQALTAAQPAPGASGSFAPVTDELIREASLEDESDSIYIDDVDDSDYDTDFTQTGAIAGPGYVEMPKSRFRKFFDKFRRDKDDDELTPQEWLDVDDDFEARAVGKARGGWESFQDESYDEASYGNQNDYYDEGSAQPASGSYADNYADDYDDDYADGTQAFPPYSQIDAAAGAAHSFGDQVGQGDYFDDAFDAEDISDEQPKKGLFRKWHGGAFSPRRMEDANLDSEDVGALMEAAAEGDAEVDAELEQIYQFRNPEINTEVWFVALGSELAGNAGMKAFLEAHERELKGSFIVQVDALGAGELTLISEEGPLKPSKPSSRMKRYLRKASQATGVKTATAPLLWEESAASLATKHGLQAVHLVGMEGGKPAGYGEQGDVAEIVDGEKLAANTNFLMALLKNF